MLCAIHFLSTLSRYFELSTFSNFLAFSLNIVPSPQVNNKLKDIVIVGDIFIQVNDTVASGGGTLA